MHERRQSRVERRGSRRSPFVAAVRHEVGANIELALAQNLGPTGMELKRPAGPSSAPSTPVSLAFELPDGGELVNVRGAVVFERSETDGQGPGAAREHRRCGVRFESLSPLDHARILRALRQL
jgi:hypothetical protein